MTRNRKVGVAVGMVAAFGLLWACQQQMESEAESMAASGETVQAPYFEVDPFWPQPFPDNWLLGNAIGVHVDDEDVIWMIHRSSAALTGGESGAEQDPPTGECCVGAPPVLAFDQDGNIVHAWGGDPGEDYQGATWPTSNHGIFVDDDGFVWIGGNGGLDSHMLKLTKEGDLVEQIGEYGARQVDGGLERNSHAEDSFGRVADVNVDEGEVFVADGYYNRRLAVVDAETGDMLRFWGAYGNDPVDGYEFGPRGADAEPPEQFRGPVHCSPVSVDDMVYVCDRGSNRVQIFSKDGEFVSEHFYAPESLGEGSTWDIAFSTDPDQRWLYLADGRNQRLRVIERETMEVLTTFGQGGRYPGEWFGLHSIATDSDGNLYTTETYEGKRIQKFVFMGERAVPRGDQGPPWPTTE